MQASIKQPGGVLATRPGGYAAHRIAPSHARARRVALVTVASSAASGSASAYPPGWGPRQGGGGGGGEQPSLGARIKQFLAGAFFTPPPPCFCVVRVCACLGSVERGQALCALCMRRQSWRTSVRSAAHTAQTPLHYTCTRPSKKKAASSARSASPRWAWASRPRTA